MTPLEEAEELVESIYYKMMDTFDRQDRAKELAVMWCERHIEDLEQVKAPMADMYVIYWTDVIKEIKGL